MPVVEAREEVEEVVEAQEEGEGLRPGCLPPAPRRRSPPCPGETRAARAGVILPRVPWKAPSP